MNASEGLKAKAVKNLEAAEIIRKQIEQTDPDENFLNIIGYHLQQALELWIKSELLENGVEYPKSHNITQLIMLARDNGVNLHISEYIDDHSEMFTEWESHSRYIIGYRIELRKIDRATAELSRCFAEKEQEE